MQDDENDGREDIKAQKRQGDIEHREIIMAVAITVVAMVTLIGATLILNP
ncbi:MAG: hypothetical protein M3Z96_11055 [Pseudomonadota bacterium]|nr:hypothetical protein [Pseudomonadota bacterium]